LGTKKERTVCESTFGKLAAVLHGIKVIMIYM